MNDWLKNTHLQDRWDEYRKKETFQKWLDNFRSMGWKEDDIKKLIESCYIMFEWGFAEGFLDRASEEEIPDDGDWWKED